MKEALMKRIFLSLAALTLLSVPALAQTAAPSSETYETPIIGEKGEAIGTLMIRGGANALVARIAIKSGGLTPGWHGLHFHAVGDCSDVGKFLLSKGHVNHNDKKHGLLNGDGPDEGDLPNIFVIADGSVNAEVSSQLIRLSGDKGLRSPTGSALVIHAAEDDHASQPIGNAGARVACAVIK